jgi:putative FmdB family regulatory protein
MMPVYEYFCPQCSRELEVLRPIRSASEQSDCPDCGGKAWRLVSGFGSRTGSYLQPAGVPFRVEAGWPISRDDSVATITKDDSGVAPAVEDQEALSAVDMSWLLEWQPNGSNFWFIQDWGIASVLRYLREYLDIDPAERTPYLEDVVAAMPVEEPPCSAPEVDQQVENPNVRHWPDESPVAPDPDAGLANEPMAASTAPWPDDQPAEPAMGAGTETQAPSQKTGALTQRWLPTSYYGWLMLLAACTATVVVTVVWVLAAAA